MSSSNIPWFKLALIGTFVGVSALIGYAVNTSYFKTAEAEGVEPVLSNGTRYVISLIKLL